MRKSMSMNKSRRMFKNSANQTKSHNVVKKTIRGGYRL